MKLAIGTSPQSVENLSTPDIKHRIYNGDFLGEIVRARCNKNLKYIFLEVSVMDGVSVASFSICEDWSGYLCVDKWVREEAPREAVPLAFSVIMGYLSDHSLLMAEFLSSVFHTGIKLGRTDTAQGARK